MKIVINDHLISYFFDLILLIVINWRYTIVGRLTLPSDAVYSLLCSTAGVSAFNVKVFVLRRLLQRFRDSVHTSNFQFPLLTKLTPSCQMFYEIGVRCKIRIVRDNRT